MSTARQHKELIIHDALTAIARAGRPNYETWFKIASAVTSEYGAEKAATLLVYHFPDEKHGETLNKCRKAGEGITIATLYHIAKEYGFEFKAEYYDNENRISDIPIIPKKTQPKPVSIVPKWEKPLTRPIELDKIPQRFRMDFSDLFEQAANVGNATDVLRQHHEKYGLPLEERLFRVSINRKYYNKPEQETIGLYYEQFRNETLSALELLDVILKGATFAPSQYQGRKSSVTWQHAELAVVDCDGLFSLTEALKAETTKKCLFVYTTPSHGKEGKDRFRIVFGMPELCLSEGVFRKVTAKLSKEYSADTQAANLTQHFAGNDAAKYWLFNPFGFNRKAVQ